MFQLYPHLRSMNVTPRALTSRVFEPPSDKPQMEGYVFEPGNSRSKTKQTMPHSFVKKPIMAAANTLERKENAPAARDKIPPFSPCNPSVARGTIARHDYISATPYDAGAEQKRRERKMVCLNSLHFIIITAEKLSRPFVHAADILRALSPFSFTETISFPHLNQGQGPLACRCFRSLVCILGKGGTQMPLLPALP